MKTLFTFIGWLAGMFIGFCISETIPFLGVLCIILGPFIGRKIGALIEESKEEERRRDEENRRIKYIQQKEEAERLKMEKRKSEELAKLSRGEVPHNPITNEGKEILRKKRQVIDCASKYPHAFYALTLRLAIYNITGIEQPLPGERKSNRLQRIEREMPQKIQMKCVYIPMPKLQPLYNAPTYRSIQSLRSYEYEQLYSHIGELAQIEIEITNNLADEENRIIFEDKVLDNPRRAKYYKQFLSKSNRGEDDYEFIARDLNKLDSFIDNIISNDFSILRSKFDSGVLQYCKEHGFSHPLTTEQKGLIIANKEEVEKLNKIVEKYKELQNKYRKGLRAYKKYCYPDDIHCRTTQRYLEIIEHEDEITKFEKFADEHSAFVNWQSEQREFATIGRNLNPQKFGCYCYDVPLKGVKPEGTETLGEYRVWQHFYTSFHNVLPGTSIINDFHYLSENAHENSKFLTGGVNYISSVYDTIWNLIIAYKEKMGDISIVFASNGLEANESIAFNHNKFNYLISKLDEANIPHYDGNLHQQVELTKHILILELISSNSRLKETVELIRGKFSSLHPLISYISLRKGYDFDEVKELEARKEKEKRDCAKRIATNYSLGFACMFGSNIDLDSCELSVILRIIDSEQQIINKESEEVERERKRQQELRRREEEERRRRVEEEKRNKIRRMKSCVSGWHITRYGFYHDYLYEYLKTTAPREAEEYEWNIRHLIWAFKNDPDKQDRQYSYRAALNEIVPTYERKLRNTFGSLLSEMTLVCLPASSSEKNRRRWQEFSNKVCSDLDMWNSYDYIRVEQEAVPRHLGGDGRAVLSFDRTFFNGKYVILCDDIKTTGSSLQRMKDKLESMGATVICALTIGITVHE